MVLHPDEGGGQAAPGQGLHQPQHRGIVRKVQCGQSIQAGAGQQVEVPGRDAVGRVDLAGGGEEHLLGDLPGGAQRVGHAVSSPGARQTWVARPIACIRESPWQTPPPTG
ncbi:hypothetical protein JOF53_007186 [Crossiella equi]|uniref:Uncharacterized protein n=1 Tax=Crossiella equi TaxID=130796 RepID=A0ABS5AQ17_9PSEU|nr:hypothetical protein [Crossiella equi]